MKKLFEESTDYVTFRPGGMEIILDKNNAQLTSVKWDGDDKNLIITNGRDEFFLLNYQINGKKGPFNPCRGDLTYRLVSADEDTAEVMLVSNLDFRAPFQIELHFVARKEVPGIYFYSVYRYPDSMPDGAAVEQDRYNLYVSEELFNVYRARDTYTQKIPAAHDLFESEEVMDATHRVKDGSVYTKYSLVNKEEDNQFYGAYGHGYGAFVVKPCAEYYNGGPMHCDLSLHQTNYSPVLLWHGHTCHYGRSPIRPQKNWTKVFGPALFYFNHGETLDDAWEDARAQCEKERKQWPYRWVTAKEYEGDSRCRVTGRLNIGQNFTKAYLMLVPSEEDWQQSCLGYSYYQVLTENGDFSFDFARKGQYKLHIVACGICGEYESQVISVEKDTDLGEISWTVPQTGKLLWEIGTPDFSAEEFCSGDNYHAWGWEKYNKRFPDGAHYHVGRSDGSDFYYFQPVSQWGSEDMRKADPWTITFDCDRLYQGTAKFTIAIAGKCNCWLDVDINGVKFEDVDFGGPENDASFYRSSVQGIWRYKTLELDAAKLRKEGNIITLTVSGVAVGGLTPRGDTRRRAVSGDTRYCAVMYDYLKFEIEE